MDRSGNEVPFGTFERSFRHGDVSQRIRAALNWELLRDDVAVQRARVRVHRQWSVTWLESYTPFAVWYATKGGGFAYYYYSDVHPIRLSDIDLYFENLPRHSAATIDSMANTLELRPGGSLPQVEIVTVQLPMDQLLVIDGNHRIAAVCRTRPNRPSPISVDIVEYRITAPLDTDLLPDLRHHAPASGDHDAQLSEGSLSGL